VRFWEGWVKTTIAILVAVIVVLIIGGGITTIMDSNQHGESGILPFLRQSNDPEGSALDAEPWQAEQFFILVGFVLFNLIGMGMTIAALFWFLSRGVAVARATDTPKPAEGEETPVPDGV
jgi:hypothetical protein